MNKWRFLLGFGSETGQSKSIAQGMVDIALEQHQISVDIYELDEVDKQVSEEIFFKFLPRKIILTN
jgi:flavodoxin